MQNTRNVFIKFLVDEILAKTNQGAKAAYAQAQEFSKTREFHEVYKKWRKLQMQNLSNSKANPVKPIKLILKNIISKGF